MSKAVCVNCKHKIDAAARLCPFCGTNPAAVGPVYTRTILDELAQHESSAGKRVIDLARRRQGVIIAVSALLVFLLLGALQQWASMRNRTAVTDAPAVALTEITDLNVPPDDTRPLPMPRLSIQFDGKPQGMRAFIVEPGAVPPPEVLAAQQAAARKQQEAARSGAALKQAPAAPRHP
jgi:hypothetical protein